MALNEFSNITIDKGAGSSEGYASTTPATADYFNENDSPVAQAWESVSTGCSQIFTKRTYANYLDNAGDPLMGYAVPGAGTYMSDPDYSRADMYDGTTQLYCIQRGCVPLFKSVTYQGNATEVSDKYGASLVTERDTLSSSKIQFVPFYSTTSTTAVTLTRTESALTIGSTSFDKDDFRGGVIPRYIYAICIGGGGGGGGIYNTGSAGGGGAGGVAAAVIDLVTAAEYDTTITLKAGAGGTAGGTGTTLASSKGGTGGNSEIGFSANGFSSSGLLRGGGGAGGSGNHGYGTGGTHLVSNMMGDSDGELELFATSTTINGGAGSAGTYTNSTPGHGGTTTGTLSVLTLADVGGVSTKTYFHHSIMPMTYAGGADCATNTASVSGGGGGSFLAEGGDGGPDTSSPAGLAGGRCAGGGGGHYRFANKAKGGAGGSGAILLYY